MLIIELQNEHARTFSMIEFKIIIKPTRSKFQIHYIKLLALLLTPLIETRRSMQDIDRKY